MKKFTICILIIFLNLNIANSNERSEKEIKLGVFLDDLVDIGSFEKIDFSPKGMSPDTVNSFHKKQAIARRKKGLEASEAVKVVLTNK